MAQIGDSMSSENHQELTDSQAMSRITQIILQNRIMTLSFSDATGPWATPVFYAPDDLNLIFVSSPGSRHGRMAKVNPVFAAAIHDPKAEWRKIRGLQMSGVVAGITNKEELKKARAVYTKQFPFTSVFFNQKEKLPAVLKEKISDVQFYQFRPQRIVLVDNTVSFGFHKELLVNI
jgi:uncharacterized protein YhbP (UPF0306 family)